MQIMQIVILWSSIMLHLERLLLETPSQAREERMSLPILLRLTRLQVQCGSLLVQFNVDPEVPANETRITLSEID